MPDLAVLDRTLVDRLRVRGQRVTSQRLVIHRAVAHRKQHMTAEQVHDAVANVLPGTSLPTVYATLELLEERGLVRRLPSSAGVAAVFDSHVEPHAHAICRNCGAIVDVEQGDAAQAALASSQRAGFQPDHADVVVWGRCAACGEGSSA